MRMSEARKLIHEKVSAALGDNPICERCGATFKTMNNVCTAELLDPCPGFLAIDKVQVPIEREVLKL